MAAEVTWFKELLGKIAEHATFLYTHWEILIPALIVAILAAIGVVTVHAYYREHGARETAKKASWIFVQSGYTAYSVLKHLMGKSVTGAIVAAIFTLVGGVPHILHEAHASPVHSEQVSPAAAKPGASRELVPVNQVDQAVSVAPVAPVSAAAPAPTVDPLTVGDIAVKVAQHYPYRKVKARSGDFVITIYPGDDAQGGTRSI